MSCWTQLICACLSIGELAGVAHPHMFAGDELQQTADELAHELSYVCITGYQVHRVFLSLFWYTCAAINISVLYSCGFFSDILLLTLSTKTGEPVGIS